MVVASSSGRDSTKAVLSEYRCLIRRQIRRALQELPKLCSDKVGGMIESMQRSLL